jgi:sec-independent protein translocase protein TatA
MELAVILLLALLVFGPKKLPEIGRSAGEAMRELRKASRDLMSQFHLDDEPHPAYSPSTPAIACEEPLAAPHDPPSGAHPAAGSTGAAETGTVGRPEPSAAHAPERTR